MHLCSAREFTCNRGTRNRCRIFERLNIATGEVVKKKMATIKNRGKEETTRPFSDGRIPLKKWKEAREVRSERGRLSRGSRDSENQL